MAQFIIEIPNADVPRVREAFLETFGYEEMVPGSGDPGDPLEIPNPTSPTEFVRQRVIDYMRSIVAQYEVQVAREAAEKDVRDAPAPVIT